MISKTQVTRPRVLSTATAAAIAALIWLSTYVAAAAAATALGVAAPVATTFDTARVADTPDRPSAAVARLAAPANAANIAAVRWPTMMPPDRIEVNIATALLQLFRNDVPIFTTRVVVGGKGRHTPEFEANIESILFNPSWYVPHSIASAEILPKLKTDPGYLRRHHMVVRNGSVVQLPGPSNALGQLKFEMPNPYDVYLHDTPLKYLFNRDDRRQSHGCVRVQNPRQLAALLLLEPIEAITNSIADGDTHREFLPTPMPIFIFHDPTAGRMVRGGRPGLPAPVMARAQAGLPPKASPLAP